MSDLILAGSHGGIVAQISLDIGGYHMTVNTLSGDEPRARNLSRHGGCAGKTVQRTKTAAPFLWTWP